MTEIRIKRAYCAAHHSDGQRILVDRLWPRGLKREQLALTAWMKEVAPSSELRRWFGHDPGRWAMFCAAYELELDASPEAVQRLTKNLSDGSVTLIFGAKDLEHNHARVLASYINSRQALHDDAFRSC